MSTSVNKPAQPRPEVASSWSVKSADTWSRWFDVIEAGARPVSERMIELAGIGPGSRVLDLATGLGEPAMTAARYVEEVGYVEAIDSCRPMIDLARDRASRIGLDNIQFRDLSAEDLDYPDGAFDAILSRWGLMFVDDLPSSLRRFRRFLRPGGALEVGS